MLAAIKEMASYRDEVTGKCHLETANYLEACYKLFETGNLSHEVIDSLGSPVLQNMKQGFKYFKDWHQQLSESDTGTNQCTTNSLVDFNLHLLIVIVTCRGEVEESTSKGFSCLAGKYLL